MNKLVELVCQKRGYNEEFLFDINNPDHDELKDIDNLCVNLKDVYDDGKILTILPDFDTDGIMSGCVGLAGFGELGFKANLYIPDSNEGYGVTPETIDDLLKHYPDTDVIITCDTGITSYAAAKYCRELGKTLYITDHHNQQLSIDSDIVVNPKRLDESYSHPEICGAFVFWQVLDRYAELYCSYFQQEQIRRLRVFAGIGTVSDTMPVLYENRQLLKDAIDICQYLYGDGDDKNALSIEGSVPYCRAFYGLYNIMKVCAARGKIKSEQDIDEGFFGFQLAPMLNSPKRLGKDISVPFGIFFDTAENSYNDAVQVFDWNDDRKRLIVAEVKKIDEAKQPYAPYVYISDAHPGILGLLAMQLYNRTGVPTFVVQDEGPNCKETNRYHGSGRSPEWFNCNESLKDIMTIAGHDFAFGCGIANEMDLQRVYNVLSVEVPPLFDKYGHVEEYDAVISTELDGDVGIDIDMFRGYVEEIKYLKPFGKGFPEPVFKLVFTNHKSSWETMKNGIHLKIMLPMNLKVVCWNQGPLISQKSSFDKHVVFGTFKESEFKGERTIDFYGELVEQ